ncbi:MAG: flagellar basal-body rod protein FlgF [Candidatus Polarisedimenticolaceae bacterium]|nr:flagellar basal-body rod protein FlgF [Candidatus Polarisedimenticolaceae bacterium]
MDRMLFVAMSGATETMLAQANNNNNMANANTPGFLQDLNQFRSMPVFGDGHPTRVYAMNERPEVNFEKGQMQQTGNDLDIAVRDQGWIAVQAPDGSEAYTRRGDLQIDANGILTNGAGLPVIGNAGPIALPPEGKIDIGSDGTITILPVGSTPEALAVMDRIKLVNPPTQELVKGNDGLMRLKDGSEADPDASVNVVSGMLESSNVNVVESLVTMIELSRRYEAQVKMMRTAKEIDESAASIMRMG